MKIIIGGLLVVSLMSGPAVVKAEVLAYEVLKDRDKIICVFKKEYDVKDETSPDSYVDAAITDITDKGNSIRSLLKEKNRIMEQIQTALDLRAYAKTPLNEDQIQSFTEFTALYRSEGGALQESLYQIEDKKELGIVIDEIIHKNTDNGLVLNELTAISDVQSNAINSLNAIIDAGERTLEAL